LSAPSSWRRIRWVSGRLAVCRLEPGADEGVPPPLAAGEFLSITRAPGEISVVCEERFAPPGARVEGGWAAMRLEGPIPFEATGVLASLATPLAAAAVGIFAVSTYDTDYVLVKEADASRAQAALEAAGFIFRPEEPASSGSEPAARASS
jgi:hypothetical protein